MKETRRHWTLNSSSSIISSTSPSTPTTMNSPPHECTTITTSDIVVLTIDPTFLAYDVDDLGAEWIDEKDTTGGAALLMYLNLIINVLDIMT